MYTIKEKRMSIDVYWDDLIRESKNILSDGDSGFEGIDAFDEIINMLLLKYCELNGGKKYIENMYKKFCIRYEKNKNVDDITKLYHFQKEVYDDFVKEFNIILTTNFTIEHKYDLADLIIKMYHTFDNVNVIFDNTVIMSIEKYLKKHYPDVFLPKYIVNNVVDEINPNNDEIGSDECCGIGQFLTKVKSKNIFGSTYTEKFYKLAILNLICNGINCKNVKYDTFLSEINLDKVDTCDYIIGCYDRSLHCQKCNINPDDTQFLIKTKDNIVLLIQTCLHKLKSGGRCGLVVPYSILYNNGVNKNNPSLEKMLSTTIEYKIRKLLVDDHNLYKLILFPNDELVAIFFIKDQETTEIEFINYETDDEIIVDVEKIKENLYCLMPNMYVSIKKVDGQKIKKYNLTQSKIIACKINNKEHDRLNYRNIMHRIYSIIGDRKKIKKKSLLNIEFGEYTNKGYKYMKKLDISIQGTDAKTTLYEIINQCEVHKIKLELNIKLNNGIIVGIR
jgi:hypothetical protein